MLDDCQLTPTNLNKLETQNFQQNNRSQIKTQQQKYRYRNLTSQTKQQPTSTGKSRSRQTKSRQYWRENQTVTNIQLVNPVESINNNYFPFNMSYVINENKIRNPASQRNTSVIIDSKDQIAYNTAIKNNHNATQYTKQSRNRGKQMSTSFDKVFRNYTEQKLKHQNITMANQNTVILKNINVNCALEISQEKLRSFIQVWGPQLKMMSKFIKTDEHSSFNLQQNQPSNHINVERQSRNQQIHSSKPRTSFNIYRSNKPLGVDQITQSREGLPETSDFKNQQIINISSNHKQHQQHFGQLQNENIKLILSQKSLQSNPQEYDVQVDSVKQVVDLTRQQINLEDTANIKYQNTMNSIVSQLSPRLEFDHLEQSQ
eukprot:403347575